LREPQTLQIFENKILWKIWEPKRNGESEKFRTWWCIQKFPDWPSGARTATRCSCVAILWVSLVSFAAITLRVSSERVFVVVSLWLSPKTFGYTLLFTTASRMALEPTQPPIQWVPGALSLGVKRLGREADYSPPSSAEVKEWVELYLHPHYAFMAWCSVKAQGQL
jgi:hypothetical protein